MRSYFRSFGVSAAVCGALGAMLGADASAAQALCQATSGPNQTPVLELYTSEGCSSCPPADQWLSGLKPQADQGLLVAQAFHVAYWDYIGWTDRFANPLFTVRQRQIAAWNQQNGVYTPQLVKDGADTRSYQVPQVSAGPAAMAQIVLRRNAGNSVDAVVTPQAGVGEWAAYWSVTEDQYSSHATAGENAGRTLKHDFVVRQYVPIGTYRGAQTLRFNPIAQNPEHLQRVNLIVFNPGSGRTLQALSLVCRADEKPI